VHIHILATKISKSRYLSYHVFGAHTKSKLTIQIEKEKKHN